MIIAFFINVAKNIGVQRKKSSLLTKVKKTTFKRKKKINFKLKFKDSGFIL